MISPVCIPCLNAVYFWKQHCLIFFLQAGLCGLTRRENHWEDVFLFFSLYLRNYWSRFARCSSSVGDILLKTNSTPSDQVLLRL